MGKIIETDEFTADIYQIEITDDVIGGEDGISNKAAKALANRTLYLKNQVATKAATSGSSLQRFKVSVAIEDNEAVNKLQMENALGALDVTSITGFKNLIINGCLRVNQRGATTIDETANAYNFDRWYYDGTNFIQYIEDKDIVLSGVYTLSWVGTATVKIDGVAIANGGQVTLTANTQVEVKFNSSNFNLVQLEYGNKKTNFEVRPYALELNVCQRYYEEYSEDPLFATATKTATFNERAITLFYKNTKRINPSISFTYSGSWISEPKVISKKNTIRFFGTSDIASNAVYANDIKSDAEIYPI